MKLQVLIADKLSSTAVEQLREMGAVVRFAPDTSADDLPGAIGDAEVLVVRSTNVTAATIDAAPNLSLIVRAGAGVNTIDLEAAGRRCVTVANCPGRNTAAVAELAIGLLISADRRIPNATADLRSGAWRKKEYGNSAGLAERTLAIIGFGAIGRAVAARARGLGMQVIAWSRSLTPETAEQYGIRRCETMVEAAKDADAVTVHLAASPDTRGILDAVFFDAMKEGAIFVNTSRGEIVQTEALQEAIAKRGIRAALDVYEDEPAAGDATFGPTHLAEHVMAATPHIGASTRQAAEAIATEMVRVVRSYVETGKPLNAVNLRERSTSGVSLVVRHYNRVGVLAGVLDELRNAGINIEEMENTILTGGTTASCTLKLDHEPDEATVKAVSDGKNIIQVMVK